MDDARAVGGQMGEPAVLQKADQNSARAVLDEVRAVDEDDGGLASAGQGDAPGALRDQRLLARRAGRRG